MDYTPPSRPARPMLFGPGDLIEGYLALEKPEWNATFDALKKHTFLVQVWYQQLTLYRRMMSGEFHFPGATSPPTELHAWELRQRLLGLGLGQSKAALDMLLAGYYSVAFAAIRHMIETWLLCRYAEERPVIAAQFFRQAGAMGPLPQPPRCWNVKEELRALLPTEADFIERSYQAWRLMSRGSHPTGVGLVQTLGEADEVGVFGASYNIRLCAMGFDHGLVANDSLMDALVRLGPRGGDWPAELNAHRRRYRGETFAEVQRMLIEACGGEDRPRTR